jgi:hypothetical protein
MNVSAKAEALSQQHMTGLKLVVSAGKPPATSVQRFKYPHSITIHHAPKVPLYCMLPNEARYDR